MNQIIELLERTKGTVFINEDGLESPFELLPPLSEQEIGSFESRLPCPLPDEIRELLYYARGFKGVLDEIVFCDLQWGFGMEEVFPYSVSLAGDGFGNFWIVDLTTETQTWGPIFYACHDAPVIVYQADDLLHFLEEAIRFGNKPWKSEIDDVHEEFVTRIWRDNPDVLTFEDCTKGDDRELREFAQLLDPTWEIVDLRNARLGDGFSWGRYGAKTNNKRFGAKRIFAYQKKTFKQRFLNPWR